MTRGVWCYTRTNVKWEYCDVRECWDCDKGGYIDHVIWTEVAESHLLTEKELKVTYRDELLEGVIRHVFHVMKKSSKLGHGKTHFPPQLIIKDPLPLPNKMSLKVAESGLDIKFSAWNLSIAGLQNVMLKNLTVMRHIGLKDIHVVFQLVTADITLSGMYRLNGTGLHLLPITGIKGFQIAKLSKVPAQLD